MHAAFSSKETNFDHVPIAKDELDIRPDADYFYICANNTIYGTEYQYDPGDPGRRSAGSGYVLQHPVQAG